MHTLEALMGPSWRSTTIGLISIATGLVLFVVGYLTGDTSLKVLGIGMIPPGGLALVVRDNAAAMAAHEESLKGIEDAKRDATEKHEQNAKAITAVVETAQVVAAQTAQSVAAQTAIAVVDDKLK